MSDKYVIRNCPALYQINGMTNECLGTDYQCQDCTDCVLKQIVEMCNNTASICKECNSYDCRSCGNYTNSLDKKILQKLDIEECE